MMYEVKNTFNERKTEIETYFTFLSEYKPVNADDDLFKILKSNLLIMLYNLIESSISNAIEAIHNDIFLNTISFNSLKKTIKFLIIRNVSRVKPGKFVERINDIALDIVKHTFNKKELLSGNVDRSIINELGDKYGFSSNTNYANTKHGNHLVVVKNKRNDLAHGIFSFSEVGREFTISDLEDIKKTTICYISEILNNIDSYLQNREYYA